MTSGRGIPSRVAHTLLFMYASFVDMATESRRVLLDPRVAGIKGDVGATRGAIGVVNFVGT